MFHNFTGNFKDVRLQNYIDIGKLFHQIDTTFPHVNVHTFVYKQQEINVSRYQK